MSLRRLAVVLAITLAGCGDDDLPAAPDAAGGPPDGAVAAPDAAPIDAPGAELLAELQAIPGLSVTEESSPVGGRRFFRLVFDQPVDHADPGGAHFGQRAVLLHRGADRPMVLVSTGYSLFTPDDYLSEPTELLDANQLVLEHRYFADSTPVPTDWSFLTIEQAAGDAHDIRTALGAVYGGAWIATGASKGGMTSVYHARFHPSDLAGVAAYVAPISFGAPDERYLPFFDTVGTAGCRAAIHAYQREVLERRPAMAARLVTYAVENGLTYDLLGTTAAVESAATEWEWTFWQYAGAGYCDFVPPADADDETIFAALDFSAALWFASDGALTEFAPYYVQAEAQLGYPASPIAHLADLIAGPITAPLPPGADPVYDPAAMQDIDAWVRGEGARLLLIYGSDDPWTAGVFELGAAEDSFRLFAAGANHGASIVDLAPGDRTVALDALQRWAGVSAKPSRLTPLSRPERALPRARARRGSPPPSPRPPSP